MAKHRNFGSKKLIRSPEENKPPSSVDAVLSSDPLPEENKLPSSVDAVLSNDPLLTEILLRLPVISIYLFKVVSKRWLSLITFPDFPLRRSKIPNVDPPSGLFLPQSQGYKLAPLEIRIRSKESRLHTTDFNFGEKPMKVEILQSCNGLLLCCCPSASTKTYYVYNPSIKLPKRLLQRRDDTTGYYSRYGGLKMAFDPTKSPNYKVVYADTVKHGWNRHIQIKTYSSGTKNWEICGAQFPYYTFRDFEDGIYWNGSINWLNGVNMQRLHIEIDTVDHPILTEMQIPQNFKGKLFESRGRLLLVDMVNTDVQKIKIFEMNNWNNGWSQKYLVNVNGIVKRCPNTWKIPFNWVCPRIPSILFGEKEDEEVFLVMEINGKVAEYNIVKDTIGQICHSRVSSANSFVFIASFAPV